MLESMLFGCLISALDPVASLKIFEAMKLSPVLESLVLGESVINDAIAITMFKILAGYESEDSSWYTILFKLAYVLIASPSIGILFGFLCALAFKYINFRAESALELSMFTLLSYLPFVLCEAIQISGILCLLFVGMTMSHYTQTWLSKEIALAAKEGFNTFALICESFCFVYLGLSIALSTSSINVSVIVLAILLMVFTRGLVVLFFSALCNYYRRTKIIFSHQCLIWISGMRGAVAFSLALSFPIRDPDIIISTSQFVILFTILSLSLGIYPILKGSKFIDNFAELNEPEKPSGRVSWFGKIDENYLSKYLRKETIIQSGQ